MSCGSNRVQSCSEQRNKTHETNKHPHVKRFQTHRFSGIIFCSILAPIWISTAVYTGHVSARMTAAWSIFLRLFSLFFACNCSDCVLGSVYCHNTGDLHSTLTEHTHTDGADTADALLLNISPLENTYTHVRWRNLVASDWLLSSESSHCHPAWHPLFLCSLFSLMLCMHMSNWTSADDAQCCDLMITRYLCLPSGSNSSL